MNAAPRTDERARTRAAVLARRDAILRTIFAEFPAERRHVEDAVAAAHRVVLCLGSPRGGTSAFKSGLAASGAFAALPGEHRLWFTLLGRNFPDHGGSAEADDGPDVGDAERALFLRDVFYECGAPAASDPSAAETRKFGLDWALRLAVQWPSHGLAADAIAGAVGDAVAAWRRAGAGSFDELDVAVLHALRRLDPAIDPWYYDLDPAVLRAAFPGTRPPAGPAEPTIVEISPYVLIRPRRLRTRPERRPLLLKASSDVYRLRTLRALFAGKQVDYVHLTRNPLGAINGLLDGWAHYTFWQHDLRSAGGLPPERTGWKFDLVDGWNGRLARAPLADVCAQQWREPHERILRLRGELAAGERMDRFAFEDFQAGGGARRGLFERVARFLGVPFDAAFARASADVRPVNATQAPVPQRWRRRAGELLPLLRRADVRATAERLGYDLAAAEDWP